MLIKKTLGQWHAIARTGKSSRICFDFLCFLDPIYHLDMSKVELLHINRYISPPAVKVVFLQYNPRYVC